MRRRPAKARKVTRTISLSQEMWERLGTASELTDVPLARIVQRVLEASLHEWEARYGLLDSSLTKPSGEVDESEIEAAAQAARAELLEGKQR